MIFFDLDGTLLDHKSAEYAGVMAFYKHFQVFHNQNEEDFKKVGMKYRISIFYDFCIKRFRSIGKG